MSTLSMEVSLTSLAGIQRHTLIHCIKCDYEKLYGHALNLIELPLHTFTYKHLISIDEMQLDDLCK